MNSKTQSITSRNGSLRINFVWSNDRFAHTIEWLCEAGNWEPLLSSVEGTPDDAWPPSPPFQEVEPHVGRSGLTCLLAVGLAGTSHWSASIEEILQEGQPDSECRIRFDVACRLKRSASTLESTYQISHSLHRDASERMAYTGPNGRQVRLVSTSEVEAGSSTIAVRPQPMTTAEPTTVRWMYDFLITV